MNKLLSNARMEKPQRVEREDVLSNCGGSPLEGDTLRMLDRHGEFFGGASGVRLEFDR